MIALLARLAAFVGIPPALIYLVVYGAIALVIGSSYWWVYAKGAAHARAECKAAEYERVMYAQATSIQRYKTALAESTQQRELEAAVASEREAILLARAKELEEADADQDRMAAALDLELRAAIEDKGKADALIEKMRLTRGDCRATDRDIDVDQRMRRKK